GKTDDDGRQYQRLRQGIGVLTGFCGQVNVNDGGHTQPDASHAKNEQVDGIGDQGQPHDDLKRTGSQQQPDAGSGQYANGQGKDDFHQADSDWTGGMAAAAGKR